MKLTIPRNALAAAVERAARFVSRRTPIPVLKCILLAAEDGGLRLTGTDLQLTARLSSEATVDMDGEGSVAVPGDLLLNLVKKLPDGPVAIESQNGDTKIQFRAGRSKLHLAAFPGEEFPHVEGLGAGTSFTVEAPALRGLLGKVLNAAAKTDTARPVLTGVLLLGDAAGLEAVATTGTHLAWARQEMPEDASRAFRVVIPAVALAEVVHLLDEGTVQVTIAPDDTRITFSTGGVEVSSQLLEGSFPNFTRVIPKTFLRSVVCSRDDLRRALERLCLLAVEKDAPGLVTLDITEGRMAISANTPDVGDGEDSISAMLTGEPIRIAFNGAYVLKGLSTIDTPEVEWRIQDGFKSSALRPPGQDSSAYVIMPVRLKEETAGEN